MDETLVVSPSSGGRDLVVQAKERIQQIQQIMRAVMKPNVHFGVIPGTQDPSLYRAGAEVLAVTFRLALAPEVSDLSGPGVIRYRIRHLVTDTAGHVIAVGVGECSSDEEKFAWRAAICAEEFEATDHALRRVKYGKDRESGEVYEVHQIRTNPADQANAVLKRASTRSYRDGVIKALAASDIFKQQLEEDDEQPAGAHGPKGSPPKPAVAKPGALLEGTLKAATRPDRPNKRPGRLTLETATGTLDLGFWEIPGELAMVDDWAKLAGKPCRFSYERKEGQRGKTFTNLTFLQFTAPSAEASGSSDLFPS